MFAPNYIENKLKFFPHIKEAVVFGHGRDMVCAFVNIDVGSVGNWAERRGLAYSGYTDLAQKTEVYGLIRECVEKVNAELASESGLADSQIHRFLILHKELDPDDDELTRTRKVRRGFVAEKYGGAHRRALRRPQVAAHRDAGALRGRPDQHGGGRPAHRGSADAGGATAQGRMNGQVTPSGVAHSPAAQRRSSARSSVARQHLAVVRRREGADRHQLRRARARDPRDHRTERRGQELDAQRDQRRLPAAEGHDHVSRRRSPRHEHARRGGARHRPHVPEHRAVSRHVGARQHHDRPQPEDEGDLSSNRRSGWAARGAKSSRTARRSRR